MKLVRCYLLFAENLTEYLLKPFVIRSCYKFIEMVSTVVAGEEFNNKIFLPRHNGKNTQ